MDSRVIQSPDFLKHLGRIANKAGRQLVTHALVLWFCLMDAQTPNHVRIKIVGALAYLLSPLDLIPDITPLLGYSDDFGVLIAAYHSVKAHVQDRHWRAARAATSKWLGEETV